MQDLSHLSKGWPSYGASMAAGSTVDNAQPQGKAAGTPSEQTELSAQGVSTPGKVSPDLQFDGNVPHGASPSSPGKEGASLAMAVDNANKADATMGAASAGRRNGYTTSYTPGPATWKTVKLWNPAGLTTRSTCRESPAACAAQARVSRCTGTVKALASVTQTPAPQAGMSSVATGRLVTGL